MSGRVERIILSRPAVEAGERLGFLPGDLRDKVDPYLRPIFDALNDMLPADQLARRLGTGEIEVAPIAFMRGRTLSHAFVILDEAQNTTPVQMKMFLTRLGEGSRMVVTGDPTQVDLPAGNPFGSGGGVGDVERRGGNRHCAVDRPGCGAARTRCADRARLRSAGERKPQPRALMELVSTIDVADKMRRLESGLVRRLNGSLAKAAGRRWRMGWRRRAAYRRRRWSLASPHRCRRAAAAQPRLSGAGRADQCFGVSGLGSRGRSHPPTRRFCWATWCWL